MPGGRPVRPAAQNMSLRDVARFYSRVGIRFYGCWDWLGTPSQLYGLFSVKGQPRKAHRISYELAYGRIPDGMVILHRCDNPRCVRPEHLCASTQRDNVLDMDAKGRRRNQNSRRILCMHGHYDWVPRPEGGRRCRSCTRVRSRERWRRRAAA